MWYTINNVGKVTFFTWQVMMTIIFSTKHQKITIYY